MFSNYKLLGNNIILNTKKITAVQNEKDAVIAAEAQRVIDKEAAKVKLMGAEWTPLTESEFQAIAK